jgi:hypothetical protein
LKEILEFLCIPSHKAEHSGEIEVMKRYLFFGIAAAALIGQTAAYAAPQDMTTRQAVTINSAANIRNVDPQLKKLQEEVQTLQARLQRIEYIHRSHQQYVAAEVQSLGGGG